MTTCPRCGEPVTGAFATEPGVEQYTPCGCRVATDGGSIQPDGGERGARSVDDTDRSPLPDTGVAATGYVCQNFPEHPGEEPEMVSAGPGEGGRICPECGRMTGGPDDEIPYADPPYDEPGLSITETAQGGGCDD